VKLAFKYRLFTNANQERELGIMLESHRRIYNQYLDCRELAYQCFGASMNYQDCSRWFKTQRRLNPYFARLNFSSVQATARRLDQSFTNFFRRVKEGAEEPGYPKFKGKDRFNSVVFPSYRDGVRLTGNRLYVQHVGKIKVKLHRPVEGTIKTVSLKREAGKWYVVFACELPGVAVKASVLPPVGIDVGLTDFLVDSNGKKEPNPRYLQKTLPELRRVQRAVSRKKKGGKNRRKSVLRLQALHARVANQRREHHYEVACKLVNAFGYIVVESLNIKEMIENGKYSRAISDVAWGGFLSVLQHKCQKAGAHFVTVDPKGTSQTCTCGQRVPKMLWDRWHECPACGLSQQRDHVSAQVILARGLAGTGASLDRSATALFREAVCL
jgi:putative transposase